MLLATIVGIVSEKLRSYKKDAFLVSFFFLGKPFRQHSFLNATAI